MVVVWRNPTGTFDFSGKDITEIPAQPQDITELPADQSRKVWGWLNLSDCAKLEKLPDDLEVSETLFLCGCTALTVLPSNLRAGQNIYLDDCVSLRSLPVDIVAKHIDIDGCTSLLNCLSNTCVYSNIIFDQRTIIAVMHDDALSWCKDNDIDIVMKRVESDGNIPVEGYCIEDAAQLFHFKLKWG